MNGLFAATPFIFFVLVSTAAVCLCVHSCWEPGALKTWILCIRLRMPCINMASSSLFKTFNRPCPLSLLYGIGIISAFTLVEYVPNSWIGVMIFTVIMLDGNGAACSSEVYLLFLNLKTIRKMSMDGNASLGQIFVAAWTVTSSMCHILSTIMVGLFCRDNHGEIHMPLCFIALPHGRVAYG